VSLVLQILEVGSDNAVDNIAVTLKIGRSGVGNFYCMEPNGVKRSAANRTRLLNDEFRDLIEASRAGIAQSV
jgi:hypothetical protein